MDPAYPSPLTDKQHAELGELTVAIGQIDEILIRTVARLLNIDRAAANLVMGSSKVADNSHIWQEVVRNRSVDSDILWLVDHAINELRDVSSGRNDFIHAWFDMAARGNPWGGAWGQSWGGSWAGQPVAI